MRQKAKASEDQQRRASRSLTGDYVFRQRRALMISLDDDKDELRRRVYAVLRHHGISREQSGAGYTFGRRRACG
jgi:hypothetical protein